MALEWEVIEPDKEPPVPAPPPVIEFPEELQNAAKTIAVFMNTTYDGKKATVSELQDALYALTLLVIPRPKVPVNADAQPMVLG